MIINLGSKNKAKLVAVKAAFSHYFKDFKINQIDVDSKVHSQPKSLKEIVQGAKNRAISAFNSEKCDFAVGIESGIFEFPGTHSGYMDTSCTVIFDGKEFFIGSSPCVEFPKKVVDMVLKEDTEFAEAFKKLSWGNENLRHEKGAIGFLTKGVVTREKYTEYSVIMALVRIINKEVYD